MIETLIDGVYLSISAVTALQPYVSFERVVIVSGEMHTLLQRRWRKDAWTLQDNYQQTSNEPDSPALRADSRRKWLIPSLRPCIQCYMLSGLGPFH